MPKLEKMIANIKPSHERVTLFIKKDNIIPKIQNTKMTRQIIHMKYSINLVIALKRLFIFTIY